MFGTDGRYCVTKRKMSFWVLLSCLSADSLPVNFISDSASSIRLRGKPKYPICKVTSCDIARLNSPLYVR